MKQRRKTQLLQQIHTPTVEAVSEKKNDTENKQKKKLEKMKQKKRRKKNQISKHCNLNEKKNL